MGEAEPKAPVDGDALPQLARFEIVRPLGRGAAGMVYEALDRATGSRVAIKTLRTMNGEMLLQLKSEFRALQDIEHENLIRLDELVRDGDTWLLAMELVDGVRFAAYVTGQAGSAHGSAISSDTSPRAVASTEPTAHAFNEARLRDGLAQLARGLGALHAVGKVHRDIKPDNVLVTLEGRVVILDLGLVREATAASEEAIVGTALYMAPEQVMGLDVDPACDWYAVGVILYLCLTGRHPFEGPMGDVMTRKLAEDPPPPSAVALAESVPPDLDALCMRLLQRDPSARPTGSEVVAHLREGSAQRGPSLAARARQRPFVGRAAEYGELTRALAHVRAANAVPVAVLVAGESGVGKSALVQRFTRTVPTFYDDALVLSGRCHEREAMPYKALDGIVDAVSQHLSTMDDDAALALLPSGLAFLLHAFPVLQRVSVLADRSIAPPVDLDALGLREARARLFAALRELLGNLAATRTLILVIEDMQWADADSLAMLQETLAPPHAPPLLLLMTTRTTSEDGAIPTLGLPGDVRTITLARLTTAESVQLAEALLEGAEGQGPGLAATIAAEARGHPFFLSELVRHMQRSGGQAPAQISLDHVFDARVRELGEAPRRLLDVLAVAGIALRQATALSAADVPTADYAAHVRTLRVGHLARLSTREGEELVETYHDRVREAVASRMSPAARRAYHERIAQALEAGPKLDADALATQWLGAGDTARGLAYVVKAAEHATRALAFERSAQLYERALSLFVEESPARQLARLRLAEAHANAGRGVEAARAFGEAADAAPQAEALDLRRRQAEHLLNAGRFDEGEAVMHDVLARVGLRVPSSPIAAVAQLLIGRARLWMRGFAFEPRAEGEVDRRALTRLDACAGVAQLLGVVDTIRAASLQTQTLLLALDAGEPARLLRAFGVHAVLLSAAGPSSTTKVMKLLAAADALAERVETPQARGSVLVARGFTQYMRGEFREGYTNSVRGIDVLVGQPGTYWDRRTAHMVKFWSLMWLGRMRELVADLDTFLRDADARGDLYGSTSMRAGSPGGLALLCGDDPEWARQNVREATRRWTQRGYHNQHYWSLYAESQVDLYEGKGRAVHARVEAEWPQMKRSLMFNVQTIGTQALWLRARAALVTAGEQPALEGAMLRAAAANARALARTDARYAPPVVKLIEASIAAIRGRDEDAVARLRGAITELDALEARLCAEASRWRLGQLVGGDEGRALTRGAEEWAASEGVRNPPRFLALTAPGFARRAASRPRLGAGHRPH